MNVLTFLLYLLALVSFLVAAFRPAGLRVELVALGLAFAVSPLLIQAAQTL